jgi:putative DNA methylase
MAHLGDASISLVLTDPPYFDFISYSELGHFFVPWMVRFGLIDESCLAAFPADQLAAISKSPDATARFTVGMTRAFKEIRRVCKEDARIVFTYQNLDGRGWEALATAMSESGVIPVNTFPFLGDCGTRLHRTERSISWDAIVVCRVGKAKLWSLPSDLASGVTTDASRQWSKRIRAAGLDFTDGDLSNLGFALAIVEAAGASERPNRSTGGSAVKRQAARSSAR